VADSVSINERLRYVVANTGMTDQDFAATVHIDRSQFGRILRGQLNITLKQVMEISSLYSVRAGWLLEGEGPIYKTEKSDSYKLPDLNLLTQLKEQIDQLISLHKPSVSAEVPNEENVNQGAAYSGFERDKNPSFDKR
jgi:transcriptional regulator with XRE-family HTH domain